jgi:predicted dehydrogenase
LFESAIPVGCGIPAGDRFGFGAQYPLHGVIVKRVAVIGCGAIADSFHLPGLERVLGGLGDVVLVDPNEERARDLARRHGAGSTAKSHHDVLDRIEGAIVASPHHTHVPIVRDLVEAGVPALCEKPLGVDAGEVSALADLVDELDVVVAVNQTRRFIPATREMQRLIATGTLGSPLEVDAVEGDKFDWPAATPSMFGARSGGRGLLLDIGVHVLDLMVDWFGPELELEEYVDDSVGGSEASVLVRLSGPGVAIRIRLSWLAKQRNDYRVSGPGGTARWGIYDLDRIAVDRPGRGTETMKAPAPGGYSDLAVPVLEDFFGAVRDGSPPRTGPRDVLPSMRLIEACYAQRTRFDLPWHSFDGELTRDD